MALLPVLTAPNPRLKIKAEPVERVDEEVRRLMDDMLETMYASDGMGLAATQVGIDKRIIVIDLHAGENGKPPRVMKLANPEVLWASEETAFVDEACLSVPNLYAAVGRPTSIKIRYLNEHNKLVEIEEDGPLARCIQHEIDHLDGILYIDHLSRLKREIMVRKLMKARKY
ncbi:MAG: N-formylmethionyl-tRNA deformylase [Alphaproteobacteria bacterium]|jgi:peptide deformylase|nr:N-formylmethionyl-tRNA deformylase [Alphaproteobacteria bacterium]